MELSEAIATSTITTKNSKQKYLEMGDKSYTHKIKEKQTD